MALFADAGAPTFACYKKRRQLFDHSPGRNNMPMHTPSAWTFWLSVALVVVAILSTFVSIPVVSMHAFWIAVIGYVILVIGCTVKTT
jgi:hypothetical protein